MGESQKPFPLPCWSLANSVLETKSSFTVALKIMIKLKYNPYNIGTSSRGFVTNSLLTLFCFTLLGGLNPNDNAQAQDQTKVMSPQQVASYWQQIETADHRIQSVKAEWQRLEVAAPDPSVSQADIEESARRIGEKAKADGQSPVRAKEEEDFIREIKTRLRSGFQQRATLSLIRIGQKTRVDIIGGPQEYPGISPKELEQRIRVIDYYDAKTGDAISFLESFRPSEQTDSKKEPTFEANFTGSLTRDPSRALAFSARDFGDSFFLAGTGILTKYRKDETTLYEGANDSLILEQLSEDKKWLFRTTLSKATWRPLSYERIVAHNGRVTGRVEASKYRLYKEGIWFPGELHDTSASEITTTHILEDVKFNRDVAATEIKLPNDVVVDDQRFGVPLNFTIRNGQMPPESEVRRVAESKKRMRKEKGLDQKQEDVPQKKLSLLLPSALPIFGLGLIAMGCALWIRSSKQD